MNTLLSTAAKVFCALSLCLAAEGAFAQSASPTIACGSSSQSVCDKIDNMNIQFVIDGIDDATLKSYSQLAVTCTFGNSETVINYDCKNHITNFKTNSQSLGTLASDNKTGSASRTLTIKSARLVNSAIDQLNLAIVEPASITWTVYATPIANDQLPTDDPQRLSILNDNNVCGFEATLETGSAWADFSTYEWSISNNSGFNIIGNGPDAILAQRRVPGGVYAESARTTTVTVKQTVGGVCSATYSKEISLLGRAEATLGSDKSTADGTILICTSATQSDDPSRQFSGYVDVTGTTPMSVTLSTGDKFTVSQTGRQPFSNAYVAEAGRVTISQIVDANGCVTDAQTSDYIHGGISVYDRKPSFSFPTDSLYTETTSVSVNALAETDADNFSWGVVKEFRGYNAGVSSTTSSALLWSNMQGKVGYYAVEVAPADGDLPECPSDTAVVYAYFNMPFRYPNAFSPNGDGKNDKLVIEGLPASNQIFVFDSRGKTVFEKTDYRNNWGADDLDDGYYVYVLKGDGIKTVKESLAIKRTSN